MRLPSLNALRAFEAVARHGSVTRAADELAVTQSAVSRHIRALEEDLGVVLFRRLHRSIRLSPEGEALAASLAEAFDVMVRGVARLRNRPGEVRIRVLPTIGTRWLLPRLHRFETANPQIRIRVSVLWDCMTPDDAEHDLGVCLDGDRTWPEEDLIPLFQERLTPVCAPAYLARSGPLDTSAALTRAAFLHCSNAPDWRLWLEAAGFLDVDPRPGEVFDTMDMALRAAESGRGVAMADLSMVEEDLALGRLVQASPFVLTERTNYFLVRRDAQRPRADVDAVVAWLRAECAPAARPARAA